MSTKKNTKHIRQRKKALVTAQPARRFNIKIIALAGVILAFAAGAGLYITNQTMNIPGQSIAVSAGQPAANATQVSFPLKDFADGRARYYSQQFDGITVKFFILKSSDGVVRAAFDACDVCWRAGKGYAQQGDNMVCRNCGRQFASVMVNEVQGGCNPAPLYRSIEGSQLVIRIHDIQQGSRFFDFQGKV